MPGPGGSRARHLWTKSAVRVGQRRAREVELALEEPVRHQVGVLLVTAETVAIAHVAKLPHAQPADLRLRVVRVEVPGGVRRRHRAAPRGVRRARVDLARRGVGLELDLRVPGPAQGPRLLLQEGRWPQVRGRRARPVGVVVRAVEVQVAVLGEEIGATGDLVGGRGPAVREALWIARRVRYLLARLTAVGRARVLVGAVAELPELAGAVADRLGDAAAWFEV